MPAGHARSAGLGAPTSVSPRRDENPIAGAEDDSVERVPTKGCEGRSPLLPGDSPNDGAGQPGRQSETGPIGPATGGRLHRDAGAT